MRAARVWQKSATQTEHPDNVKNFDTRGNVTAGGAEDAGSPFPRLLSRVGAGLQIGHFLYSGKPILTNKDTMTNQEIAASRDLSVSIVVPVYNGEATLEELCSRIQSALDVRVSELEIVLVNDGSHDDSWGTIKRLADSDPKIRGLNLMRNYGQHNALLAGVECARYDVIVTIDDDLQHPPEEIVRLLDKLDEGYDVVYGKPLSRSHSVWRNLSSKIIKTALKVVLGAEMGAHSSAFRAFRSILRRGFRDFSDPQLSIDVLLSWAAARVTHVTVEHHSRRAGRSGYTLRKLVRLTFSMITGYSTLPLRVASMIGLATSMMGLAMFFYVVIRRLMQTEYVPGFAFIAAEIALFAGLQLFAIGVIGEYLARVHFRTMGQPPYVIREHTEDDVSSK